VALSYAKKIRRKQSDEKVVVLEGHGFSRAVSCTKIIAALAAEEWFLLD
jgi:hypothetical protein